MPWEICALSQIALLGAWLVAPEKMYAWGAMALALAAVVLAARVGDPARVAASVFGLAGAGGAFYTSDRVLQVETQWADVHEELVVAARDRLESTLSNAVTLVEALADRGASLEVVTPRDAFAILEGGLAGGNPERGVVVFEEGESTPWAWAGSLRLSAAVGGAPLRARVTPFYVILEAESHEGARVAVGQVVLAADSAVPDRGLTVAARFERATGSTLEFFRPREAPFGDDVFDYCIGDCSRQADSLFSVRPVPPTQGTLKLRLLDQGGRRVSLALAFALVATIVVSGFWSRALGVFGAAALLVLTPLGSRLGLEAFFSSGTFFLPVAWFWYATVGTLFVVSGVVVVFALFVWRAGDRSPPNWFILPSALLVGVTPTLIDYLASGVTVPAAGPGLTQWIGWVMAISLAGTTPIIIAGLLFRRTQPRGMSRAWPWLGVALAVVLGIVGIALWRPNTAWPPWFTMAWAVPFVLVVLPGSRGRLMFTAPLVAGLAGGLATWSAVADGRILLAQRDINRFTVEGDPFPLSFLERFGAELGAQALPQSSADLYARWRKTPLSRDDYPAVLVMWDPSGAESARLELAGLDVRPQMLRRLASTAVRVGEPQLEEIRTEPGVHYILSVPFADGSVVSVAVGPRSRAIPSIRVAQFLKGDGQGAPPYEVMFADPVALEAGHEDLAWERTGLTVLAAAPLATLGGLTHLHVTVPLGEGFLGLGIRGALLAFLNVVAVALCWLLGELIAGRVRPATWFENVRGQSYRVQLTVVLGVFFIVPTIGFTLWSIDRIRAEAVRSGDLVTRQALQDASGAAFGVAEMTDRQSRERLNTWAATLGVDLVLYHDGRLVHSTAAVLSELGLLSPYLSPELYNALVLDDGVEYIANQSIGGRRTRVGYRSLGGTDPNVVLASPRLIRTGSVLGDFFTLMFAAVLGLMAAVWLAARAASGLAQPVRALTEAAIAVGSGEPVPSFDTRTPREFVPVVTAFEKMAADIRSHQQALEGALQFTGAVLRNVATGVITLDADLRATTANPRAIALLGTDPVSYQSIREETDLSWAPVWDWVGSFMHRGEVSAAQEFTVGDKRVRAQVAVLSTDEGGCVVAMDDATELAMAERVLAWGEMARQVAHEIKNPLTPIRLGIQHLQRTRGDERAVFDETLDRTARQILAEIERLDGIARAFSRFGAPPSEILPLSQLDVVDIARETVSLYGLSGETTVTINAQGTSQAWFRRDELKEVLVNLIENARAAGSTEIGISVSRPSDLCVLVLVKDNGRGISPDNMKRIFEPQFSTTSSGTGLGLAICKRLVESWHGTIEADSTVDVGTTVTIALQTKSPIGA